MKKMSNKFYENLQVEIDLADLRSSSSSSSSSFDELYTGPHTDVIDMCNHQVERAPNGPEHASLTSIVSRGSRLFETAPMVSCDPGDHHRASLASMISCDPGGHHRASLASMISCDSDLSEHGNNHRGSLASMFSCDEGTDLDFTQPVDEMVED